MKEERLLAWNNWYKDIVLWNEKNYLFLQIRNWCVVAIARCRVQYRKYFPSFLFCNLFHKPLVGTCQNIPNRWPSLNFTIVSKQHFLKLKKCLSWKKSDYLLGIIDIKTSCCETKIIIFFFQIRKWYVVAISQCRVQYRKYFPSFLYFATYFTRL